MKSIIQHPLFRYAIAYIIFDVVLAGIGMGLPILNILAAFIIGWYFPAAPGANGIGRLRAGLHLSAAAAIVTSIIMFAIWSPEIAKALDPAFDYTSFGIPQILYTPIASFIGWMVLMIFISPFLQMLASLFTVVFRLAYFPFND